MKIAAVIPARFNSTRFPGKPLALISGRPMIWWVHTQVKKVGRFDDVFVATDDDRIKNYCEENNIKVVMTSDQHPNHIFRIHEISELLNFDYYVCINGDEPMIEPQIIESILEPIKNGEKIFALNLMTAIKEPTQAIDFAKIKIVTDENGYGIYMSRSPVPYPRGSSLYKFKKYVGVECFTKEALDFYVGSPMSTLEKIEDIDHLRFIENGKKIKFIEVESETLSVDTPKDLDKVIDLICGKED
ncbi:3-deoxy-manno-octulosonate cytidylyltransferase (CMP-KDO synthetase) [Paenibacillus polysaccharolyticus]|uniref:3-deoxy-manno-octulosonate cytidylyltransferase (CMP-KDO synthetase) n=1 Tax=Paenibacillus polysaccharolyticus TaxID=582692 RepID=A0A1G5K7V0_9BACL|nr:3-deoxy-manno-octulosonate cytidylyltransferase [Paenibacillus polysaccharolyticus]SCY96703.1 3-deoxy-manno-octulosonate cytidylyltransferase (CMP-KDO synthetase) [Paenibacillus polysaccharolyticus]